MSRYLQFDRSRIELWPLDRRGHDLTASTLRQAVVPETIEPCSPLSHIADEVRKARSCSRPVVVFLGGHPVKLGLSCFLIQLIQKRFVTHLATNGAAVIHDFELALAGGTSEDVAHWIVMGQFGLWRETASLNDIICMAAERGEGLGEAVGRIIEEEAFPHRSLSLTAAAWRAGIPFTCHVNIGCDIIHSLPNCDGAALGRTSYTDFLIFARTVQDLEGGVFLNIGSAVTGPEVYLKAVSMARNVARQEGKEIRHFTTAVFDLISLPDDWRDRTPTKDDPLYYYRPWKTILVRTVADGGASYYVRGDHRETIPALWHLLTSGTG